MSSDDILKVIIILVIAASSVILHELAHGVTAYFLGDKTAKYAGRLSLNPLKHIDPFMSIIVPVVLYLLNAPVFGAAKPVPIAPHNLKGKEWGMALVAIAGPLTNFLLALIAFLIGYFTGILANSSNTDLACFACIKFVHLNLGFLLFNLIPIPPLDGSRVLYAIAPDAVRGIMNRMEVYGFIIIYALIIILGNVFSGFMADGINGIINFFFTLVGAQGL